MKLLMIGCGKMGGALLEGWLTAGLKGAVVVDPGLDEAPTGTSLAAGPDSLAGQQFDLIIIAIKPQMVDTVLPAYHGVLAPGGCFVSIAAGASLNRLQKLVDGPVIRVMPNLPALIGKGITAIATNGTRDAHLAQLQSLFAANGSVVLVDGEEDIDRFTAVAGSGPGYVFEIVRCYLNAAEDIGFSSDIARKLVLETLVGSADMALMSQESMETLRNNVTSKAGTTEAGLKQLRDGNDLETRFKKTIRAAFNRAQELG